MEGCGTMTGWKVKCEQWLYPYMTEEDWFFYNQKGIGRWDTLIIPATVPVCVIVDRIHRLKRLRGDFFKDGIKTSRVTYLIDALLSKLLLRGVPTAQFQFGQDPVFI